MGDLISTTATNIQGLGNSSQGQRSVAKPKVVVAVRKKPMTQEQKLKCQRKQIEAQQYSEMGMKSGC